MSIDKLEVEIQYIKDLLKEVRADVKELRGKHWSLYAKVVGISAVISMLFKFGDKIVK